MKKKISVILTILSLAGFGDGYAMDGLSASSATLLSDSAASAGASATAAADSSQFLMDAYRDGLSEIQLSQLALQKSANSDVKSFAQRMIDQHTKLNG